MPDDFLLRRHSDGSTSIFVLNEIARLDAIRGNAILASLIGAGAAAGSLPAGSVAVTVGTETALTENERLLPPDENNPEATKLTRAGTVISSPVPLWSGDPRIQSIAIPRRAVAPGDRVDEFNADQYTGPEMSKEEALALAKSMFEGKGIVYGKTWHGVRFSTTDFPSTVTMRTKNGRSRNVMWGFQIRPPSDFARREAGESKVLKPKLIFVLPNGWLVTMGDYKRGSNGKPGRRDLKDLPRTKPFAEVIRNISRAIIGSEA